MANKNDTRQFLNRELHTLAVSRGAIVVPEQANINQAAANRAGNKATKRPKTPLPEVGKVITP